MDIPNDQGSPTDLKLAGYAPEPKANIQIHKLNDTDFRNEVDMAIGEALATLRDLTTTGTKEMVQFKAAAKILDYALELNATLNGEERHRAPQTTFIISDSAESKSQLREAAEQITRKIIGDRK